MDQLLEKPTTIATVPIRAAEVWADSLANSGGEMNLQVAEKVQGQISVAQLSGRSIVDITAAINEVVEAERVDDSIESLVGLVIDLRH